MRVRSTAIVVAAGRGTRLGAPTPKAFVRIGGVPMLLYSLRTLTPLAGVEAIVLVVGSELLAEAAPLVHSAGPWPVPVRLTPGGAERQDSVAAGLARVEPTSEFVIIHDAARPFVSPACVRACLQAAGDTGAAIVALRAHDTVKLVDERNVITATIDRQRVWLAQTPQVFRTALLREAYERAHQDGHLGTDDAGLVERLGVPVRVVEGDAANRKITTPDDLRWAEAYLQSAGPPH